MRDVKFVFGHCFLFVVREERELVLLQEHRAVLNSYFLIMLPILKFI